MASFLFAWKEPAEFSTLGFFQITIKNFIDKPSMDQKNAYINLYSML